MAVLATLLSCPNRSKDKEEIKYANYTSITNNFFKRNNKVKKEIEGLPAKLPPAGPKPSNSRDGQIEPGLWKRSRRNK